MLGGSLPGIYLPWCDSGRLSAGIMDCPKRMRPGIQEILAIRLEQCFHGAERFSCRLKGSIRAWKPVRRGGCEKAKIIAESANQNDLDE